MSETKTAKNNLSAKVGGQVAEKKRTIFDVIEAGKEQFAAALPKHLSSERFTRIAITCVRQNPKLAECSVPSLLGSLMTVAQLGLEPGVLGQCYLIPFKNTKLGTTECQLQLGYKGMIELLRRTGQLSDIYAYPVYSNDEFTIEYGLERKLTHKPAFNNPQGRGLIVGFYSVAILKDGTRAFEYMTSEEVKAHEEKYRKGKFKNDIWVKNYEEMAMKTVTKKMLKWLPISVEMIENLRKDNGTFEINKETKEVVQAETPEMNVFEDAEVIDENTGEILKEENTAEVNQENTSTVDEIVGLFNDQQ